MTERLLKETLKKLYIKEKKTVREIAEMHDCPDALVRYRLRKCGIRKIPILLRRIVLKKSLLQEFYIKDGKSTREIAKSLACSPETVRQRCKEHEIEVRPQGGRTICLDKPILQRLYVKEGKSLVEAAELLSCSPGTVRNRCKDHGIMLREPRRLKGADKK